MSAETGVTCSRTLRGILKLPVSSGLALVPRPKSHKKWHSDVKEAVSGEHALRWSAGRAPSPLRRQPSHVRRRLGTSRPSESSEALVTVETAVWMLPEDHSPQECGCNPAAFCSSATLNVSHDRSLKPSYLCWRQIWYRISKKKNFLNHVKSRGAVLVVEPCSSRDGLSF